MLTEKQIEEIKEHMEKAQNPVFYYDNDADGLCSFIILRRFMGRGKGVAVKSYPDLNVQYAKRIQEFKADYVFILDKPVISKEFMEEVDKMQIPVVWIDHHDVDTKIDEKKYSNLNVYNPTRNKGKAKSSEPVTYLVYKLSERKEDLWFAVMGCIADHFMPDFASEFAKEYPDLWGPVKRPFDAYYKTEIGKIAQSIGFGLKDSISNVVEMQNFLVSCRGPGDVLSEVESNKSFRDKYGEITNKYNSLLEKAKESVYGNLIFFDYSGELSISSDLANELSYLNHGKFIAVAYVKGGITNISLRGKGIRNIFEKIHKKFDQATGGGHENAVGMRIKTEDLAKFREAMEKEVNG